MKTFRRLTTPASFRGRARLSLVSTGCVVLLLAALADRARATEDPSIARLIAPTGTTVLDSSTATFAWTQGEGVTRYRLALGTSADVVSAAPWGDIHWYEGTDTSVTVHNMPKDGSTVHARVWSQTAGGWLYNDYAFATVAAVENPAVLVSPAPGTELPGRSVTFTWSTGDGVTDYRLAIGTSAAAVSAAPWADVFFYAGTATSALVDGLPKDGSPLHVRLWSKIDGAWQWRDYTVRSVLIVQNPAELASPAPGSTLPAGPVTFRWTAGDAVTLYRLAIGTSAVAVSGPPWADLFYYEGTATSATATGLPEDASTLHVRLWSKFDDGWESIDYTVRSPLLAPAEILSPTPGTPLTTFVQDFTWSRGVGTSEYRIGIATTHEALSAPSGGDLYVAALGSAQTVGVPGLPRDGSDVHVRLWSRMPYGWRFTDYVYPTAPGGEAPVEMIAPAPGAELSSRDVEFAWRANVPVETFRLAVADDPAVLAAAPGANVHYSEGTTTSRQVTNLPLNGDPLYVRLWFQVLGRWFFEDTVYATADVVPAELTTPAPGSTLSRSDVTFQWNAGSGAQEYRLALATAPEVLNGSPAFDIGYYEGTATSATFASIPLTGGDVHVRLWSRFGEDWYIRDYVLATVDDVPGPGTYDRTFLHEGLVRSYRLHLPPGYEDATPMPMVIALHGNDARAADMEQLSGLSALADEEGFLALYPEASLENQRFWFDGRDGGYPGTINEIGFIAQLVAHIEQTIAVDTRRIYATGFSGGAALANTLGVFLPDQIAAIAPVAGTLPHLIARTEEVDRPMPVFYIHGTADPFAYYFDGGSTGTERGASLTAMNLVTWWAGKDRVLVNEEMQTADTVADGTRLTAYSFRDEDGRAIVVFNSIEDGGHTWPGGQPWGEESVIGRTSRELDASRAMWTFFRGFSLASPELQTFTGYPFEWPPVWRGAGKLSCQWSRRTLAWPPGEPGGVGYGEDNHSTVLQWGFPVGLPEGTRLMLFGEFPHARYFDFQVSPPWDPDYPAWRGGAGAQPIAIVDQDIDPLPGHVNPYRPGVSRLATNRRYAVVFELRSAPAEEWDALNGGAVSPPYRRTGYLRIGGQRSGRYGELGPYIEMRIRAPDQLDPYGGVATPTVLIELPGEAPVLAPPVAELYRFPRGDEDEAYWVKLPYHAEDNPCLENGRAAKDQELLDKREAFVASVLAEPPPDPGLVDPRTSFYRDADDTVRQFKMFGINHHACVMQKVQEEGLEAARETCPASDLALYGRGADEPPPRNDEHTNGMDLYNSYLASVISPYPGEVVVFEGRAPDVPRTLEGPASADWDAPVRYWSLCTAKDRVVTLNCVMDEHVPLDASGRFRIVIAHPEDRPVNATPECGIAWLPLLARGVNTLWRMKSTDATAWPYALQNVPWHGADLSLDSYDEDAVRDVMGEYYPEGRYTSRAEIEALGCNSAASP